MGHEVRTQRLAAAGMEPMFTLLNVDSEYLSKQRLGFPAANLFLGLEPFPLGLVSPLLEPLNDTPQSTVMSAVIN